jgi:hypothetical protein
MFIRLLFALWLIASIRQTLLAQSRFLPCHQAMDSAILASATVFSEVRPQGFSVWHGSTLDQPTKPTHKWCLVVRAEEFSGRTASASHHSVLATVGAG